MAKQAAFTPRVGKLDSGSGRKTLRCFSSLLRVLLGFSRGLQVAVVGSGYSPRDDGTLVDLEEFMDKPVAFFFPYGGAVLWGFTETEATSLLVDVETFATNMLTEDEAEVDRMIFGRSSPPPLPSDSRTFLYKRN